MELKTKERTFQSFEKFKIYKGIKSEEYFLHDFAFRLYVQYILKNVHKSSFLLKEIVFECLPYPSSFNSNEVSIISSNFELEPYLIQAIFDDFLQAGCVKKISESEFKRVSKFYQPE